MSNAKQRISVFLMVQADSLSDLQIFGGHVDDVAAEMKTIEVFLINREDEAARDAVIDWLNGADETLEDELVADDDTLLMLVAARLRHIASTRWGRRRYMAMESLLNPIREEVAA